MEKLRGEGDNQECEGFLETCGEQLAACKQEMRSIKPALEKASNENERYSKEFGVIKDALTAVTSRNELGNIKDALAVCKRHLGS